jgi:hypothetical protein
MEEFNRYHPDFVESYVRQANLLREAGVIPEEFNSFADRVEGLLNAEKRRQTKGPSLSREDLQRLKSGAEAKEKEIIIQKQKEEESRKVEAQKLKDYEERIEKGPKNLGEGHIGARGYMDKLRKEKEEEEKKKYYLKDELYSPYD